MKKRVVSTLEVVVSLILHPPIPNPSYFSSFTFRGSCWHEAFSHTTLFLETICWKYIKEDKIKKISHAPKNSNRCSQICVVLPIISLYLSYVVKKLNHLQIFLDISSRNICHCSLVGLSIASFPTTQFGWFSHPSVGFYTTYLLYMMRLQVGFGDYTKLLFVSPCYTHFRAITDLNINMIEM